MIQARCVAGNDAGRRAVREEAKITAAGVSTVSVARQMRRTVARDVAKR